MNNEKHTWTYTAQSFQTKVPSDSPVPENNVHSAAVPGQSDIDGVQRFNSAQNWRPSRDTYPLSPLSQPPKPTKLLLLSCCCCCCYEVGGADDDDVDAVEAHTPPHTQNSSDNPATGAAYGRDSIPPRWDLRCSAWAVYSGKVLPPHRSRALSLRSFKKCSVK